jgi:activator of HSP90 ATPase
MNVLNPSNWNTDSYDSKITSWDKALLSEPLKETLGDQI